jgi:CubicO group peptidase (beta-lactamase class C family)
MAVAEPTPSTPSERLDALFAPFAKSDAPGLAVGVVFKGEVAYRKGFGMASLEHFTANSPGTLMRIGSTTKHMTALLALLLAEDGRLDLDVPIRTYLPELIGPAGDPSIRLLLEHRGGSRCYLDLGFIAHGAAAPTVGYGVKVLTGQSGKNFDLAQSMIYNNGGYHLASHAIARAGGAPIASLMKSRLFDPLGMNDTRLLVSDHAIVPGMATLHVPEPGGGWRRGLFPSEEVLGEGGVLSTVDDMMTWMRHLKSRDVFGAPSSWAQLFDKPQYAYGEESVYALGMMVTSYRGRPQTHHAGGVVGGVSQMAVFPEDDLQVVILCNGAPGADPVALAERVADILLEESLAPAPEMLSAASYGAVLGNWWSKADGMVYGLHDEEGMLKLSLCMMPRPFSLAPDGADKGRAAPLSIADIVVDLSAATKTGRLPIVFGGETAEYERLPEKGGVAAAALAPAAVGAYVCADAGCTAKITLEGGQLEVFIQDPFGSTRAVVEPYGSRVGVAFGNVGGTPFYLVLTFEGDDGPAASFQVNTPRTRRLLFTRA